MCDVCSPPVNGKHVVCPTPRMPCKLLSTIFTASNGDTSKIAHQTPKRRKGKFNKCFSNAFLNLPLRSGGLFSVSRQFSLGSCIRMGLAAWWHPLNGALADSKQCSVV